MESIKLNCPYCGNRTPHKLLSNTTAIENMEFIDPDMRKVETYYEIVECLTCDRVSIYMSSETSDVSSFEVLIYPEVREFYHEVPEKIRNSYNESKKVKNISPTSYVILIRKTLELICVDQNAVGRNLKQKIENLQQRNILPAKVFDVADILRKTGNNGAHGEERLTHIDVQHIDEMIITLIELVYIIPRRIDHFTK